MLRVSVDPGWPEKNLEVAEEVADDKEDQDQPCRCDDHLPAHRGAMKGSDRGHRQG